MFPRVKLIAADAPAGSRLLETEAAATPQRSTRGDDYDTFFEPSGNVVIVGTTGGVSMRSWRVQQMIVLGKKAGADWLIGYQYRQDRSEFHPGLKSTRHTQPPSFDEFWSSVRSRCLSTQVSPSKLASAGRLQFR